MGDIDIVWGEPGTTEKSYSDGCGLAHIIAKHGASVIPHIAEIIAKSELSVHRPKGYDHITRAHYHYGDYVVHLIHHNDARNEFFVITGWDNADNKNTNVHPGKIQERAGQMAETPPSSLHERSSVPSLSQSLPSSNTHAEITGPTLQKRGEGWGSEQWSDKGYSVERDYATTAPAPATPVQNEADKKRSLTRISDIMNKLRKIRPVRQGVDAPKSVLGHIVDYKLGLRDRVANSA